MAFDGPNATLWTRRALLHTACLATAAAARVVPTERKRLVDPATEFEIQILTDPAHACYLPRTYNPVFSRKGDSLLYASDRDGSLQAYSMEVRSGESRQITEAAKLDRSTLTLTPDFRGICYLDGGRLMSALHSGSTAREVYKLAAPTRDGAGMSITADGPSALLIEGDTKLLMVNLAHGTASTVAENKEPILDPMPRPKRASAIYRTTSGGLWLAHFDASRNVRLKTAPGVTGMARWAPDGRTILYLNTPEEPGKAVTLRELNPDTGEDKLVAPTTQFISFSCNSDGSVLVGASSSKASPYVLLLIRNVRRELTLSEHKASDPTLVSPVFEPDSQRVFFQSDRHGKPAIYSISVEKLVEKTESENQ